ECEGLWRSTFRIVGSCARGTAPRLPNCVGCALLIDPRIYRAAFVPALLAIVLTMFSFQSRPPSLEQGLAADVLFDGKQGAALAPRIAAESPDRRPGSPGNLATAQLVADTFAARGFGGAGARPVVQRFTHAGHDLVNVVGRRAGSSRRQ